MASITRPLNLRANITSPDTRFEWVAALNVLLAGALLFFLGSRYIYAPGLQVDVSGAPKLPAALVLPQSAGRLPGVSPQGVATVLTIQQDNVFLYEGGIHSFNTLERALRERGDRGENPVLLLKIGREVSMQTFVSVCELAHRAGFASVQVAVESLARGAQFRDSEGRAFLNTLPSGN